jgi:hypothetical protein
MKSGITHRTAFLATSAGVVLTFLIYYFSSAVPPGATLPVFVEGPQTTWTNVKIHQTPTDSAEVAYLLKVHHSLPKFSISATFGILLGLGILWCAGSSKVGISKAPDPVIQNHSAEQAGTGPPSSRPEPKPEGSEKPKT